MAHAEKQTESTNVTPIETRQEPASNKLSPFEEMNRMFDHFLHRNWMQPLHWEMPEWSHLATPFGGKMPRMDVIDRDKEIVVKAELPGVNKEDLDISMTDNTVVIKGSTTAEEKEEKDNYYRSEISHGAFARTMVLPAEVDVDKAKTEFKHGVLTLTVPKLKKNKRNIEIH